MVPRRIEWVVLWAVTVLAIPLLALGLGSMLPAFLVLVAHGAQEGSFAAARQVGVYLGCSFGGVIGLLGLWAAALRGRFGPYPRWLDLVTVTAVLIGLGTVAVFGAELMAVRRTLGVGGAAIWGVVLLGSAGLALRWLPSLLRR